MVAKGAGFRGTAWVNVDVPLHEWAGNGTAMEKLREIVAEGKTTLLYSVKDAERNHALILLRAIQS